MELKMQLHVIEKQVMPEHLQPGPPKDIQNIKELYEVLAPLPK